MCLSVDPSFCAVSCPVHNVFCFDIGLPYLARGCITMGRCVTDIHGLSMTLTFGLTIRIIFSPLIFVWARLSLLFDIGIPNLAYGCNTMRQYFVYIQDLCMTLTFNLCVNGRGGAWGLGVSFVSFTYSFILLILHFSVYVLTWFFTPNDCTGSLI